MTDEVDRVLKLKASYLVMSLQGTEQKPNCQSVCSLIDFMQSLKISFLNKLTLSARHLSHM